MKNDPSFRDDVFEQFTLVIDGLSIAEIESIISGCKRPPIYLELNRATLIAMPNEAVLKKDVPVRKLPEGQETASTPIIIGWYLRPPGRGILPVMENELLPPMMIRFHF